MSPRRSKKSTKGKPRTRKDPVREIVRSIFAAAFDVKALDIIVLDLRRRAAFADYLVICTGTSDRQTRAIAERIDRSIHRKFKRIPLGVEGTEHGRWILIDYGDVIVHIFLEEAREFYRLEDLWHDARHVNLALHRK